MASRISWNACSWSDNPSASSRRGTALFRHGETVTAEYADPVGAVRTSGVGDTQKCVSIFMYRWLLRRHSSQIMTVPDTPQTDTTDDQPTDGLLSLSTLSGSILWGLVFGISGIAILFGQSIVGQQVSSPLVLSSPILSAGGAIGLIVFGIFLHIVAASAMVRTIAEPAIGETTEYGLIGRAGLAGVSVAVIISLLQAVRVISLPAGIATGGVSLVGAIFLGIPLVGLFYGLAESDANTTGGATDERELDPETVRDQTVSWSDENTPNEHRHDSGYVDTPTDPHRDDGSAGVQSRPAASDGGSGGSSLGETTFDWQRETNVSFADVGGMGDVKKELHIEVIKPLAEQEKAEQLGVHAPNIVFHGPPGTGKTFMAEALATELDFPFVRLSGADIQSKWINESAQKVNALFTEAKGIARSEGGAVIFLDELDSVLSDRSAGPSSHREDSKVVNEFLNHLEATKDSNIVFIGATNRLDALDEAGIRSGRIDKKIHIGKPDAQARAAVLRTHLDKRTHALSDEEIQAFVEEYDAVVSADIAVAVETAAKRVLVRDGDEITAQDVAYGFQQTVS